ncbi:MAG: hypothetical protein ACOX6T_21975 [Myxococcales bacterium]|jgi:hypothetical protein
MAYTINRNTSLPALRWYTVRVIAGLDACGFSDLVGSWRTQRDAIATTLAAHTTDEEQEEITSARVRVCDAAWDESVASLSKKALFLAGGDDEAAPYSTLFGTTKAKALQALGPAKATVAGDALLSKMTALGLPQLAEEVQNFGAKNASLRSAEAADAEAELKLASHSIDRARLIRQVETLMAETEAKILMAQPGRIDLVRTILNPNKTRRASPKTESNPTNETPEG